MGRKRWSELSPAAKAAIVVGGLAEIVVTSIALRDLVRRPGDQVRGSKPPWGVALFVQPFASPLYLLVGRRRPTVEAAKRPACPARSAADDLALNETGT